MKLKLTTNTFGYYTIKELKFRVLHQNKLPSLTGGFPNWTVNLAPNQIFIFYLV